MAIYVYIYMYIYIYEFSSSLSPIYQNAYAGTPKCISKMHTLDPVWREMLPSHVCSNPIQYPAEAGWEVCGQWQFVLVIPDSLKKQLGEKQHTRLVIIVVVFHWLAPTVERMVDAFT